MHAVYASNAVTILLSAMRLLIYYLAWAVDGFGETKKVVVLRNPCNVKYAKLELVVHIFVFIFAVVLVIQVISL